MKIVKNSKHPERVLLNLFTYGIGSSKIEKEKEKSLSDLKEYRARSDTDGERKMEHRVSMTPPDFQL